MAYWRHQPAGRTISQPLPSELKMSPQMLIASGLRWPPFPAACNSNSSPTDWSAQYSFRMVDNKLVASCFYVFFCSRLVPAAPNPSPPPPSRYELIRTMHITIWRCDVQVQRVISRARLTWSNRLWSLSITATGFDLVRQCHHHIYFLSNWLAAKDVNGKIQFFPFFGLSSTAGFKFSLFLSVTRYDCSGWLSDVG